MDIITVKPLPNYEIAIEYQDGSMRRFDMKPLLTVKPWNRIATPEHFAKVNVAYGTVVWPEGIDISPETLWLDSVAISDVQN